MAISRNFYFSLIVFLSFSVCFTISKSTILTNKDLFNSDTNISEGRTFGQHLMRRISFALIPAAFVVGVITTLLAALTVVSLKGLGIGVILLILGISQIFARSIPYAHTHAAPALATAPLPLLYSHHDW